MEYHWGKHHRTYVDNLNKQIAGGELDGKSIEEIVKATWGGGKPKPEFNNAAQTWSARPPPPDLPCRILQLDALTPYIQPQASALTMEHPPPAAPSQSFGSYAACCTSTQHAHDDAEPVLARRRPHVFLGGHVPWRRRQAQRQGGQGH